MGNRVGDETGQLVGVAVSNLVSGLAECVGLGITGIRVGVGVAVSNLASGLAKCVGLGIRGIRVGVGAEASSRLSEMGVGTDFAMSPQATRVNKAIIEIRKTGLI